MKTTSDIGLLFLHALPLDGRIWAKQLGILPDQTHAPDLYAFGPDIKHWAAECLRLVPQEKIVVVGCSVGGSCSLEVINLAPDRVVASILIGTKARHDPDPTAFLGACQIVKNEGVEAAWAQLWRVLFENGIQNDAAEIAEQIAVSQSAHDILNGLKAFHTRPSRENIVKDTSTPMHIVTGDHDPLPGIDYARHLTGLSKQAHLHIVPDCVHYVPMMQPAAMNALIEHVIRTVDTA